MQKSEQKFSLKTTLTSITEKSIKTLQFLHSSNPFLFRMCILGLIYFLGFLDLFFFAINGLSTCDFTSYTFNSQIKFLSKFFKNSFLRFWGTPERSFITSYIVLELMINRAKTYKMYIPKFYRYHILVVFAVIMLQSALFSTLDLFLHREFTHKVSRLSYKLGTLAPTNVKLVISSYISSLFFFSLIYTYGYIQGLYGKLPRFIGANWFNDSLALWLRIKTPTLKI
jgi:hypothetical protein